MKGFDDVSNPEVRLRRELILLPRLVLIVNDTELVALLFDRQFRPVRVGISFVIFPVFPRTYLLFRLNQTPKYASQPLWLRGRIIGPYALYVQIV